jgi:hypothetical protein
LRPTPRACALGSKTRSRRSPPFVYRPSRACVHACLYCEQPCRGKRCRCYPAVLSIVVRPSRARAVRRYVDADIARYETASAFLPFSAVFKRGFSRAGGRARSSAQMPIAGELALFVSIFLGSRGSGVFRCLCHRPACIVGYLRWQHRPEDASRAPARTALETP